MVKGYKVSRLMGMLNFKGYRVGISDYTRWISCQGDMDSPRRISMRSTALVWEYKGIQVFLRNVSIPYA
jgi:hypothetical protein